MIAAEPAQAGSALLRHHQYERSERLRPGISAIGRTLPSRIRRHWRKSFILTVQRNPVALKLSI
jgi:hypothetical protein